MALPQHPPLEGVGEHGAPTAPPVEGVGEHGASTALDYIQRSIS